MATSITSKYSFQKEAKYKLGEGGFGAVYSGTLKDDPSCSVAIKIIEGNNDDVKMKEIFIMKTLKHSHIVNILDFYLDSKTEAIIVMEKASKSLSKLIKENENGFNKEYLLQIFLDILTGLHYAHKKNISHSDIKPANVLLFENIKRGKTAQKTWVLKEKQIFKLSDWGGGKIEDNIEETRTLKTKSNVLSEAYAAPELLREGKIRANSEKTDIYSLGLCILTCCGMSAREFAYLARLPSGKKHEKELLELMDSHKIQRKYGDKFFEILRDMIRFNSKDRIIYDEILERIEEIIKETQEEKIHKEKYEKSQKKKKSEKEETTGKCKICKHSHKNSSKIILKCGHNFGVSCLKEYIENSFKDNKLNLPLCPVENCKIPLKMKKIKEVLDEEFLDYYIKCDSCNIISYKAFFLRLDCEHNICRKCFENENIIEEKMCPITECLEDISEKSFSRFEKFMKKCILCKTNFTDKNPSFKMRCCHNTLCQDCWETNVLEPRKNFKEKLKESEESEEIETQIEDFFCFLCRKDLKKASMSEIFDKSSFKLYKKIIKKKIKCKNCQKWKDSSRLEELSCEHIICIKCLKRHIKENIDTKNDLMCLVEECGEKIDKKLLQKYLQKIKHSEVDESSKESEVLKFNKNSETKVINTQNHSKNSFEEFKNEAAVEKIMCVCCQKYFFNKNNEILHINKCEHSFCKKCILQHIEQNHDILRCYAKNCSTILKLESLKYIIQEALYNKIEKSIKQSSDLIKVVSLSQTSYPLQQNQDLLRTSIATPNPDLQDLKDFNIKKNDPKPDVKEVNEILCNQCKNKFNVNDFFILNCNHQFCKNCIKSSLIDKIKNEKTDLICLDPSCLKEISFDRIKAILPKEIFEKYDLMLVKKFELENADNCETKIEEVDSLIGELFKGE